MNVDDLVLLLVVEERFAIAGRGLVLEPDFAMPSGTGWKGPTFFVMVRGVDGREARFRATLSPVHLLVRDPQAKRRGWRLEVEIHGATKEDVPIGCSVWCEAAVLTRLMKGSSP